MEGSCAPWGVRPPQKGPPPKKNLERSEKFPSPLFPLSDPIQLFLRSSYTYMSVNAKSSYEIHRSLAVKRHASK